jgi:ribosomal 50S subunit-recycling heat shock protein
MRASRLVVRRTIAQELCEAGVVFVNDQRARSSRAVRVGDEITVRRRERILTARVLALPDSRNVSKSQAPTLYEIIKDERPAEDSHAL